MRLVVVLLLLGGLALAGALWGLPGGAGAQGPPPPSPHGALATGCLRCHGPQGVAPLLHQHPAYPETECLVCHSAAPSTAAPPPGPTPTPTAVGPGPTPATPDPTPAAPSGGGAPLPTPTSLAPPPSPHVGLTDGCESCHGPEGIAPLSLDHPGALGAKCLLCHQGPSTPSSTPGAPSPVVDDSYCLSCHANPKLGDLPLVSGERLSLVLDTVAYQSSVHGGKLACGDCHSRISPYPHLNPLPATRRELTFALYEVCRRCHFANYTKTLDSMHYQVLAQGDTRAAVCVDCHGAHDIPPPDKPRARVSQTCAQCHTEIYDVYRQSVHGSALVNENNQDVPVCTDCHSSHAIQDPRTPAFHLDVPAMCAQCHSDAQLMGKYGISPNVLRTYLQDFHGITVSLTRLRSPTDSTAKAVCTDCHGIHDIQSVDAPTSSVLRANLVETCRQCHPGASESFPAAWLSHYEPSLERAPLVFAVRTFYRVLIPFIIGGLSIHILLHLWRLATNR
ncbi:MAG: cytochrome c3 family protein [Chloroflexi bacterium]|nr:cytochrome c3 family protein [Chloroflexota bacterium]